MPKQETSTWTYTTCASSPDSFCSVQCLKDSGQTRAANIKMPAPPRPHLKRRHAVSGSRNQERILLQGMLLVCFTPVTTTKGQLLALTSTRSLSVEYTTSVMFGIDYKRNKGLEYALQKCLGMQLIRESVVFLTRKTE
jgi:hypothetical protein